MRQVLTGRNSYNMLVKLLMALVLSTACFGAHAEKTVERDNTRYTITSEELGCYFIESTEYRSCVIELISKKKGNVFFIPTTEMMMKRDFEKYPISPYILLYDGCIGLNHAYDWKLPNLNYCMCKYVAPGTTFKIYAVFPAEYTTSYFVKRFGWTFGLKGVDTGSTYQKYCYKGDSIVISYMKADNGPVGEEYY